LILPLVAFVENYTLLYKHNNDMKYSRVAQ
jgi:hypothetical protein